MTRQEAIIIIRSHLIYNDDYKFITSEDEINNFINDNNRGIIFDDDIINLPNECKNCDKFLCPICDKDKFIKKPF